MALPARPDIVDLNGQATYHSLDAVDQGHFNGLPTDLQRRKFVEMIHRLREINGMLLRSSNCNSLNRASPEPEQRPSHSQRVEKEW